MGVLSTKFWGRSGLFPVLDRKNFLFGHPSFNGEFQWQCASFKIAKKGKRPDFQTLAINRSKNERTTSANV